MFGLEVCDCLIRNSLEVAELTTECATNACHRLEHASVDRSGIELNPAIANLQKSIDG